MKRSRKYQDVEKLVDRTRFYSVEEASELVKKTSTTKFDATVEIAMNLNLDPRQAEQNLRGAIVLPHGSGKTQRVLVLTKSKTKEAEDAGADFVGASDYIEKIKGGWFDFEVIIATPDMMGELGRIGKVLGPKGLMPNAKTGTVTMEIEKAVHEVKAGKVTYRVDKAGNIQVIAGKVSFSAQDLADNLKVILTTMIHVRPNTVKGNYLKSATVSSTMGPGIKIDASSIR